MLKLTEVFELAQVQAVVFDDNYLMRGGYLSGQVLTAGVHLLDILPPALELPVAELLPGFTDLSLGQIRTASVTVDEDHRLCVWLSRLKPDTNVLYVQRRKETCTYERFERQRQALFELARATAHDLSEPLRTLQSYADLLLDDASLSESDRQQALQFISQETARMKTVVNSLFEYAKAATTEMKYVPLALESEIDLIVISLQKLCKDRQTGVDIKKANIPETIYASELLIRAISNLISNAIKFVPADRTAMVTIDGSRSTEHELQLAITDNGIGIKADDLSKIFEPFRRLHPREQYKGSGLGLSIAKQIVEQHNGRIQVQSWAGKGTAVTIVIPQQRTPHESVTN